MPEADFYSSVLGKSGTVSDLKRELYLQEVDSTSAHHPFGEGELSFLQKFITDNGGTVSGKNFSELYATAVSVGGGTPSSSLNENKATFLNLPLVKLYYTIRSLPGLIAYYPLNETSGDAINRAPATFGQYDGTVSNATQGADGAVGKAYSFDGVGDRVIITEIAPAATFSFVCAFKRNGAPDANDRIIDQASGGPTRGWHVGFDASGNVELNTWNDSGISQSLDFGTINDDEWVVLGATASGSAITLYLNGVEVATSGGNNFGTGVIADLQFGCRSGGTNNPMAGSLQHIAIGSGVEWSAAQHAKIANFFFNLNPTRKLMIDGEEFKVRGINYSSNALDSSSSEPWYAETNQIPYDAIDMREAGFNLIKIYGTEANETEHLAAIDAILAEHPSAKFFVLDFVTYDTDYSEATGGTNRQDKIDDFVAMVNIFKQRSAVKIIGFGNENNLPNNRGSSTNSEGDVTTPVADWYSLVNEALAAGKAALGDDSILFTTVDAEVATYPGDDVLTEADIVCTNIYRSTTFTDLLQDVIALTSRPVLITEFGIERADNTTQEQQDQADEEIGLIQEAESYYSFISGHILFKWTHNSNSSQFYHITAPLADGVAQSRDKYIAYNSIKSYLTTHDYGV